MSTARPTAVFLAASLLVLAEGRLPAQTPLARQWLVTVTDDANLPVTGLGAEDFALHDGGARQPIVSVEPARGSLVVAVVASGFATQDQPAIAAAIKALAGIIRASDPGNRAVLVTHVANSWQMTDVTSTSGVSLPSASRAPDVSLSAAIVAASNSCAALADRVDVVAFRRAATPSGSASTPALLPTLVGNRTALWLIDVGGSGAVDGRAAGPNDAALDAAIQVSGTLRLRAATPSSAIVPAKSVATLLTSAQYLVTLVWPELSSDKPPLDTRHDRGVVLMPAWNWR